MKPFFESEARIAQLDVAAQGWVGTPFRHNSCVRGEGASCVLAIVGVLQDAGFSVPKFDMVPASWSRYQKDSMMEAWLDKHPEIVEPVMLACPAAVRAGDVVGFKVGLCVHHLGIVLPGGRFFQCNESLGAAILSREEREFKQRLARAWRPVDRAEAILDAVFTPLKEGR